MFIIMLCYGGECYVQMLIKLKKILCFRLCYVCLCNINVSDIWLKAIKDRPDSQTNLKFLLQSSTNGNIKITFASVHKSVRYFQASDCCLVC